MTNPPPKPSRLEPQQVIRNPGLGPILIPLALAAWLIGGIVGMALRSMGVGQ